ncbi:MAG: hypothetical protein K2X69_13535 [Silvanigrellaceae bacterium]|nr:hypothetical protein [Silvanigrellaceae bacterium]
MKKNYKKYDLSFASTMDYVRDVLEDSNFLSKYLLDLVCFQDGCFYTYFPMKIELKNIYRFKSGGICSTTYEEVAKLISCVIDDVIRGPLDKNISEFGADIFL